MHRGGCSKILFTVISVCFLLAAAELYSQDHQYEEWYLQTPDSVLIYVREIRNPVPKDTVIVVHGGFGANHDYMLDAIRGLQNDFHFVLYDQRGSLLSPASAEKLSLEKCVDDLELLIDELSINNITLLCHSMGSLIGMEILERRPQEIDRLIIVSTILPKATKYEDVFSEQVNKNASTLMTRPEVRQVLKPYESRKETLSQKEMTEMWRIQFASVNAYDIRNWRLMKGGKAYYNSEASIMAKRMSWNYDYRKLLNESNVTFIQGQYDFLDFNGKRLKDQLTGFRNILVLDVPNAGHNVWLDQPDLFRKHLLKVLSK